MFSQRCAVTLIIGLPIICTSTPYEDDNAFVLLDNAPNQLTIRAEINPKSDAVISGGDRSPAWSQLIVVPDGFRPLAAVENYAHTPIEPNRANRDSGYRLEFDPSHLLEIGEVQRLRHLRVAQLTLNPILRGADGTVLGHLNRAEIKIRFVPDLSSNNVPAFERIPSPQFQRFIDNVAVNPPPRRDDRELIEQRGYNEFYLFVLPDDIPERDGIRSDALALVELLADWKRAAGNRVEVLFISGGRDEEAGAEPIKRQISDYYQQLIESGQEPFDNILLIGEDELHPPYNENRRQGLDLLIQAPIGPFEVAPWLGHWDLNYGCLEGEDWLPDVALSRFHTGDLQTLANAVQKTIRFEASPNIADPGWFHRAVLVEEVIPQADVFAVGYTVDFLGTILRRSGADIVDQWRRPQNGSTPLSWMARAFNQGIAYYGGRAQNTAVSYDIGGNPGEAIQPNGAFPFVILSAGHGEYTMESVFWYGREYYAERELLFNPGGARGAIASTGTWQDPQTVPNNLLVLGMTHGLADLGLNFGWARNWSLMTLLRTYPGQDSLFLQYHDDFMLAGDPGVKWWKRAPQTVAVSAPDTLAYGANFLTVRAANPADENEGIANLIVTLTRGSLAEQEYYQITFTDAAGMAKFILEPELTGVFDLTITGDGILPVRRTLHIVERPVSLTANINRIDDSQAGNDDGLPNPGERILLFLEASNVGDQQPAVGVSARISTNSPFASIERDLIDFGDIAAGAIVVGDQPIPVTIDRAAPDGEDILLEVHLSGDNGSWESAVNLAPNAPRLKVSGVEHNGIIYGETSFTVEIHNQGRMAIPATVANLTVEGWALEVVSGMSRFPSIAPNSVRLSEGRFTVRAHPQSIPGTKHRARLELNAQDELIAVVNLQLQTGIPDENSPAGPDKYGYYCYDDTDADWQRAPRFNWIEISPLAAEPELIGARVEFGNPNNAFAVVDIPFEFQFYGEKFTRITVCSNGFLIMGDDPYAIPTFENWPLDDGSMGAGYGIIAPLWDDLRLSNGGVWTAYDDESDIFIIEWFDARYFNDDENLRFQVHLFNTRVWPTPTGDGDIAFYYSRVHLAEGARASQTPFASVGITSPDGRIGFVYAQAGVYPITSAPLQERRSIRFTTNTRNITGSLTGRVISRDGLQPIEGAAVRTNQGHITTTDGRGEWSLESVIAGVPFEISAFADRFNTSSLAGEVLSPNDRLEINFQLTQPQIVASRHEIHFMMDTGAVRNFDLGLLNRGDGMGKWRLFAGRAPQAGYTIPAARAYGAIAVNDNFLISVRSADGYFHLQLVNPRGELVNRFTLPDSSLPIGDLAFNESDGIIWACRGSELTGFEIDGEIEARRELELPLHGVAWDEVERRLWVAAGAGLIRVYDSDGNEVERLTAPNYTITGLAWFGADPDDSPLFFLHHRGDETTRLAKLNPATGNISTEREWPRQGRLPRGISAIVSNGEWKLIYVEGEGETSQIVVSPMAENLPWLDAGPSGGTLEPGENGAVHLQFDMRGGGLSRRETALTIINGDGGVWAEIPLIVQTVGAHGPAPFSLIWPPDGAEIDTGTFTFAWEPTYDPNEGEEINGYHLWISAGGDSVHFAVQDTSLEVRTDVILGGLPNLLPIRWWVAAQSGDDLTESRRRFTFTVNPAAVPGESPSFPFTFKLEPAYPNPFNAFTVVHYSIDRPGNVHLTVMDISGRLVKTIKNEFHNAGRYRTVWNAAEIPSGMYLIRLEAARRVQMQKAVLVK